MKKLSLICAAVVALLATMAAGHMRLPQAAAVNLVRFRQTHSVAKQLPAGFVLPPSDVDLKISSLVAADLDADGDLDIVAADAANGSVDILVWVNDGGGRLTRKQPERPNTLGAGPQEPSVDRQQTTIVASIQPDTPGMHAAGANPWLTLPELPCPLSLQASPISAVVGTERSRSPPVRA